MVTEIPIADTARANRNCNCRPLYNLSPDETLSRIGRGAALRTGFSGGAFTDIEKRSVDAWLALGRAQWQQQNFDQAQQSALKARELDSENSAVSDLLLHVYFDQNQADKFQAELDRNSKPSTATQDLAVRFF